jgi:drug/metabolite transporter (DMT)-like permease
MPMNGPNHGSKIMGPLEWGLLIILSILWGGSFFFVEVALTELPPFTVVLGRVGFAAIALILFVYGVGHRMPVDFRLWGAFIVMGALNNLIPFSLIVWGQTQIASGLASILNATTPLFTVLLAHFFTKDEKMTPNRVVGVLLGLVGVTVMIGGEFLAGLGLGGIAKLAVLGAALSYAVAGIFGRRFEDTPPLVTAAGQVTATTVLMLPVVLLVDQPWNLPAPSLTTWGTVVCLALLSTAVAYLIYFRILATAGATNLLLVTFLIPVSAILLGVTILGERLEPRHFAGMALISLGLGAIDGRPLALLRRRNHRPRT